MNNQISPMKLSKEQVYYRRNREWELVKNMIRNTRENPFYWCEEFETYYNQRISKRGGTILGSTKNIEFRNPNPAEWCIRVLHIELHPYVFGPHRRMSDEEREEKRLETREKMHDRRRGPEYKIETKINERFEGSELHHLGEGFGLYIPKTLNHLTTHCLKSGREMAETNLDALEWFCKELDK